jgi:hypothetical protein
MTTNYDVSYNELFKELVLDGWNASKEDCNSGSSPYSDEDLEDLITSIVSDTLGKVLLK